MDELSRNELFAMFQVDVDKLKLLADSEEEVEEILQFVEKNLRAVSQLIDESPSFANIWEIKSSVLPFTKVAGEIEKKQDDFEGNIYKAFTHQLSTDVAFFVWLVLAGSVLISRHLVTLQMMFGDKINQGTDKDWYLEQMTNYYNEVTRPHLENVTSFMTRINFSDNNEELNEQAIDLTEHLYSDELKDSILNLTPIYLQTLDIVFQKISGLYLESIVNGGDNL